jgi:hypothetical protein
MDQSFDKVTGLAAEAFCSRGWLGIGVEALGSSHKRLPVCIG